MIRGKARVRAFLLNVLVPLHVMAEVAGLSISVQQTAVQTVQDQPRKRLYEADKANVADAIAKVKSGDFARVHVDLIGRAGAVEAIPILKEQFVRIQDPLDKAKIAQVLIKLGDKDDTYWDFLVKLATPALESDAPDFMSYDSQGRR